MGTAPASVADLQAGRAERRVCVVGAHAAHDKAACACPMAAHRIRILFSQSKACITNADFVGGACALWSGRNACRHGRRAWEPGAAARYISLLMENLTSLKKPRVPKHLQSRATWEKPEPGWFKVNTDASFNQSCGHSGVGVVILDHDGLVKGGEARWFEDVPDALTAEALAAREGLELAMELGLDRVLLEVDCQGLAKLLQKLEAGGIGHWRVMLRHNRARQGFQ